MLNIKNLTTTHIKIRDMRKREIVIPPHGVKVFPDRELVALRRFARQGLISINGAIPSETPNIASRPMAHQGPYTMKIFKVSTGIGDFSFIYQKLIGLGEDFGVYVADEAPQRTGEFVKLLPHCKFLGYSGQFTYGDAMKYSTKDNLLTIPSGEYYLAANFHMEEGQNLADFHPELPTEYHYKINYLETTAPKVDPLLSVGGIKIGIYTSCYNMLRHWKFWDEAKWVTFLMGLKREYHDPTFYLIGATFDIDLGSKLVQLAKQRDIKIIDTIGFHISDTIYLLKGLDCLYCFPSGIAVLGDVVNTRTMMFMPPHLTKMMTTFGDPDNIRTNRFHTHPFVSPQDALKWTISNWPYQTIRLELK